MMRYFEIVWCFGDSPELWVYGKPEVLVRISLRIAIRKEIVVCRCIGLEYLLGYSKGMPPTTE